MKASAKPASLSSITEVTTATSMLISTTRITTSSINTITSTAAAAAAAPTTTVKDPYTRFSDFYVQNICYIVLDITITCLLLQSEHSSWGTPIKVLTTYYKHDAVN